MLAELRGQGSSRKVVMDARWRDLSTLLHAAPALDVSTYSGFWLRSSSIEHERGQAKATVNAEVRWKGQSRSVEFEVGVRMLPGGDALILSSASRPSRKAWGIEVPERPELADEVRLSLNATLYPKREGR